MLITTPERTDAKDASTDGSAQWRAGIRCPSGHGRYVQNSQAWFLRKLVAAVLSQPPVQRPAGWVALSA